MVGLPLLLRNGRRIAPPVTFSTPLASGTPFNDSCSPESPQVPPLWVPRPNGRLLNGYGQPPKRRGCDDVLHSRGVPYQLNPNEQRNS